MNSNYSEQDILQDLDQASPFSLSKSWFDLSNGYFSLSGSYIDLFADNDRWAIVFVKSGFYNQTNVMSIELYYFGNCLSNLDLIDRSHHTTNFKSFYLNDEKELRSMFDYGILKEGVDSIKLRSEILPIEKNIQKYKALGISVEEDGLDNVSITRYLNEIYPLSFEATDQEIRSCIPKDLPELIKIKEWNHNEGPLGIINNASENEAFKLIAKILVTKDTSLWRPTEKPNSNWRNWPESGNL